MNKLYSFIILAIYVISLGPSFLSHEHSNIHNHNESLDCKSIVEVLDQHADCSHEQHLQEIKERCWLCDYYVVYNEDLFLVNITDSENIFSVEESPQFLENRCFQEFTTYSNKSPPLLI